MSQTDVLIMAAGAGERFGGESKQFALLGGKPMLVWSLERFTRDSACDRITIVVTPGTETRIGQLIDEHEVEKINGIVPGGDTRQASVRFGLEFFGPDSERVLVHDAARPCLSKNLLHRVIGALDKADAVVPSAPAVDTMIREESSHVTDIVDRTGLSAVQTPQGFRTELLQRAHKNAESSGMVSSDDGSLVVALGETVVTVRGERTNIKVTFEDDLRIAEAILNLKSTKE